MTLLIDNTMTGRRESFEPHYGRDVSVYLCGPTLSYYPHLGHLRTYVFFDVMIRYLQYRGYRVKYVMNLTDFDDRIIARAKETGEDPLAFSRRFEQAFFEDVKPFHLRSADNYPRASDHVREMIDMIESLVQKGLTYEAEGILYFDASRFQDFGSLLHRTRSARLFSHLLSASLSGLCSTLNSICPTVVKALGNQSLISALNACFRTTVDIRLAPRRPYDFVLWNRANENELGWESPWGRGRPGWHVECSAMSMKYLGPQLDIHGGGEDLKSDKSLHHESEIALSESYSGKSPFVKYWIHIGLLIVDGQKMAKSRGNFVTVREILRKHSAESLRLFILSKHYRERISFTEDEIVRHEEVIRGAYETRDALNELISNCADGNQRLDEERRLLERISRTRTEFLMGMDKDFNTAIALASFYKLLDLTNEILDMKGSKNLAEAASNAINEVSDILGLLQEQKCMLVSAQPSLPSSASTLLEPIPTSN